MRSRKHIISFLTALVLLVFLLGGCQWFTGWIENSNPCIAVPETDSTPPTAGMLIAYYEEGGIREKTLELNQNNDSTTIHTDEDEPVNIICIGQDNEGLKSIQISVTMYIYIGGIGQTQNLNIPAVVSSCPKRSLMSTFTLKENLGNRTAKISVTSTNWKGLVTHTRQHSIIIGS